MPNFQLAKEVSGDKLVEILRTAASELGFAFRKAKFLSDPPKDIYLLQSPEKGTAFVLDFDLGLIVEFGEIKPESRYQSIDCETYLCEPTGVQFYTRTPQYDEGTEVPFDFETEYDQLVSRMVELSREV